MLHLSVVAALDFGYRGVLATALRFVLEMVGRQPLVGRSDEGLEERPRAPRQDAQPPHVGGRQPRRAAAQRRAEDVGQRRRRRPHQQERRRARQRLRAQPCGRSAARCAARSYCALLPSRGERRPVDGELEIHSAFAVEVAKFEVEDEDANQESSLRQESR
jgi:hypothetical protein